MTDGIPENTPRSARLHSAAAGDTLRAMPVTLETVAGNYVVLDLGQGRFASYGHLNPGSLRVKAGERVRLELMRGPGTWERRTNELPMQNEHVRFPGG